MWRLAYTDGGKVVQESVGLDEHDRAGVTGQRFPLGIESRDHEADRLVELAVTDDGRDPEGGSRQRRDRDREGGREALGETIRAGEVLGLDVIDADFLQVAGRDGDLLAEIVHDGLAQRDGVAGHRGELDDAAGNAAVGVLNGDAQRERLSRLDDVRGGRDVDRGRAGWMLVTVGAFNVWGVIVTASGAEVLAVKYLPAGKNSASIW